MGDHTHEYYEHARLISDGTTEAVDKGEPYKVERCACGQKREVRMTKGEQEAYDEWRQQQQALEVVSLVGGAPDEAE